MDDEEPFYTRSTVELSPRRIGGEPSTRLGERESNPQQTYSLLKLRQQLGQKKSRGMGSGTPLSALTIELPPTAQCRSGMELNHQPLRYNR